MSHDLSRLLVASIIAITPLTSATAATQPDCAMEAESFDVRAEARKNVYRIGDTALVDVWVTNRFTGTPETDIKSGLMLEPAHKKKKVVFDVGRTDDDGHILMELKLTNDGRVKPGKTAGFAGAYESINTPLYCTNRYGYSEYDNLFRIRR